MTTFIVVFVALLVERFFDWSHLRRWNWYISWENFVSSKTPNIPPYLVLAAVIVPLLIIVMLVQHALGNILFGFPLLIFQLFVVIYCLGPKNLWADTFSSISAVTKDDSEAAAEKFKLAFNVGVVNIAEPLQRQLLTQIFISANQRVFALIFWYVILGLPGALFYRLINIAWRTSANSGIAAAASKVETVLDWVPARIVTFIFALGGNFTKVLNVWRSRALLGLESNDLLLAGCGMASINDANENLPDDGSIERSAVSLLDRAFIITIIAVMVVVFIF
jgi:membrane protein required for beta-lactamase induction